MALYDTADLLGRCKKVAKRPSVDVDTGDTDWYRHLSDAQLWLLGQLQVWAPRVNWGALELMTTSDSITYSLENEPVGKVLIFPTARADYPLSVGSEYDLGVDFFREGLTDYVIPGRTARSFPGGPYARYLAKPADIALAQEPVVQPPRARLAMVYQAVANWAHEGALRDPSFAEALLDKFLYGGRPGDVGFVGELKTAYGSERSSMTPWWRSPDLSNFPVS